ncbi:alpha-ketoglutarate-dependent dioxygenase (alkylated DNA repair protein) [Citrobacter koseri]|uniref:Alpha-ketoglutarate-dependent dioxygenase (Alkylated DNA repair protein) n=1 Tax=Citrobacter koseri TaxID=545 RepID=A0A2X2XR60_CITKO|nr:alpha-ketoglutarate-dependent dioxygenase (alkylated DNA repair protein) [Citrobacter koseri]
MLDLFADAEPWQEPLASGAVILRRFAFREAPSLIEAIRGGRRAVAISPDGDAPAAIPCRWR